jgi:hypothetical protein
MFKTRTTIIIIIIITTKRKIKMNFIKLGEALTYLVVS